MKRRGPLDNQGSRLACESLLHLDVAPGVGGPSTAEFLAEIMSATGGTLLEGSVSGPVEDEGEEKNQQDESEEKSIAVFGHSTTLSLPRLRRQGICQLLYVN